MIYPADRMKKYKSTRNQWFGISFGFSLGAFFNLIPFLDLARISPIQWLFLGINTTVLIISLIVYIYYSVQISQIKKEALRES